MANAASTMFTVDAIITKGVISLAVSEESPKRVHAAGISEFAARAINDARNSKRSSRIEVIQSMLVRSSELAKGKSRMPNHALTPGKHVQNGGSLHLLTTPITRLAPGCVF